MVWRINITDDCSQITTKENKQTKLTQHFYHKHEQRFGYKMTPIGKQHWLNTDFSPLLRLNQEFPVSDKEQQVTRIA